MWDLNKSEFTPTSTQSVVLSNLETIIKKYGTKHNDYWLIDAQYRKRKFVIKVIKHESPEGYGNGYKLSTENRCLIVGVYELENKSGLISYKPECNIPHNDVDDPECFKGTFLSYLRNALYCALGASSVLLTDLSSVKCSKNDREIELRTLRVFEKKGSWYRRHGYAEYDSHGNIATKTADHLMEQINEVTVESIKSYIDKRLSDYYDIIAAMLDGKIKEIRTAYLHETDSTILSLDQLYEDMEKIKYMLNDTKEMLIEKNSIKNSTLDLKYLSNVLVGIYYSNDPEDGCDAYYDLYTSLKSPYLSKQIIITYNEEKVKDLVINPHQWYLMLNDIEELYSHMKTTNVCAYVQCKK